MAKEVMMTDTAVELLNALGCSDDPVTVLNKDSNFSTREETEVSSLDEFQFLLSPHTAKESAFQIPARKVRLRFQTRRGRMEDKTLLDMLRDRLSDYRGM